MSASQNSPSLVVPSPVVTSTTSSSWNSTPASTIPVRRRANAGLGAADRLQELRAGRAGRAHEVVVLVAPSGTASGGRHWPDRPPPRRPGGTSRTASPRAAGAAHDRGSREEPVVAGRRTIPAATPIASCPAPLIWKKIFFWRLSWISLSSIRRDKYMVRYMDSRSAGCRPELSVAAGGFSWSSIGIVIPTFRFTPGFVDSIA